MIPAAALTRLREIALAQLEQMYAPDARVFVFRRRRQNGHLVAEGVSHRYTAISVIGLAGEDERTVRRVLRGHSLADVCERLVAQTPSLTGVGDVAVNCWAAHAARVDATPAWRQLVALAPDTSPIPVVELSWALSAASLEGSGAPVDLRERLAVRLMSLYNEKAGTFPHDAAGGHNSRTHVACFADQVYPILALSQYAARTRDAVAVEVATRAADRICRAQGRDGQWWWHYDARVDALVERYPVYSVHQHAMAPMALRALTQVSRADFSAPVARGLRWLEHAPELDGGTLIDDGAGTIWRKVGRHEPGKASRYLQAAATRLSPGATWPGLDVFLRPGSIDYECRPYEFGWLLYTWPPSTVRAGRPESVPS
jgi:hypothetical protein